MCEAARRAREAARVGASALAGAGVEECALGVAGGRGAQAARQVLHLRSHAAPEANQFR